MKLKIIGIITSYRKSLYFDTVEAILAIPSMLSVSICSIKRQDIFKYFAISPTSIYEEYSRSPPSSTADFFTVLWSVRLSFS